MASPTSTSGPSASASATRSRGRVRSSAGWSLDFGITEDDRLIHASASDLSQRLPAPERQHWAEHLAALPSSRNFVAMRLSSHACFDDGEVRDWPG